MRPPGAAEDGTITLWILGLCVVLLFLGGLSLDLWRAFTERRDLAAAVDAAAVAGSSALDEAAYRRDGTVALDVERAAALACAHLRHLTDPPDGCAGVRAGPTAVEVTATREVPLTLMRVLLPQEPPLLVEVTARAQPHRSP